MIACALEDGTCVIFDYAQSKEVVKVQHGSEAVSCVSFDQNGLQLVTGSHDGSIKVWDLRKMVKGEAALLATQQAHQLKHNEGVLAIAVHPQLPLLISGGGDSLIKVFEMS